MTATNFQTTVIKNNPASDIQNHFDSATMPTTPR